jgi:hypothetical protein
MCDPALDATFLPAEDQIDDPIGVKGIGELVIVGYPQRCSTPPAGAAAMCPSRWKNCCERGPDMEKLLNAARVI